MQDLKLIRKSVVTINEFLEEYEKTVATNIETLFELDFQLKKNRTSHKIKTTLHKAEPKDAKIISDLFKEIYCGQYPYKKMESEKAIYKMLTDDNYEWMLFKANLEEVVGCFGADFDFNNKKGVLYGFAIKKSYRKMIDALKACVGSLLYFWTKYKTKILIWSGEVRTNDTASQFGSSLCGLKPIAFFPNKDIFFGRVESDFLIVCYDFDALNKYRSQETPKIIRQVLNSYSYTSQRYHLGTPFIENPSVTFEKTKIQKLINNIEIKKVKKKFGYEKIIFSLKNSNSYFKFYHNSLSKHFEKTVYKINNIEELLAFLNKLKKLINIMDINYFQCFVSAYSPNEQKVFFDEGFKPRGYVPSWKYNKILDVFEDQIVFNWFKGSIVKNIKLIPESEKMLQDLNFYEEKL